MEKAAIILLFIRWVINLTRSYYDTLIHIMYSG